MASPSPPAGGHVLRTAALYVVLVGVPALGVGGVLRVGQGLTAPPSVGGEWLVEPAQGGCVRAAGALRIEQSGTRIDGVYTSAQAGAVAFRGRVGEDQANLGEPGRCERVEVSVARDLVRPDSLRATLQTGACGCRTTEVTLVRAPAETLGGAH